MKKNDIIRLEITDLTNEENGIGRYDGIVVFVPMSAVGDVLDVRILKVKSNLAYGKIENICVPSTDRIAVDCPAFAKCGGCSFRHISYAAEIAAKQKFVEDAFTRIGKLNPEFLPIITNEDIDFYRNKAQFPVGYNADGKMIYGFFANHSHRIITCDCCKLQPEIFKDIADFIVDFAEKNKIAAYNENENSGILRHICIRKGYHSGDIHVTIVSTKNLDLFKNLAEKLTVTFNKITGVTLNINNKKTNVILGDYPEIVLSGEAVLNDTMCGKKIEISPKSFYQVNTKMAEKLYEVAAGFADCSDKILLDLYCGAGTIGLSMADKAANVIGVEIVPSAVENAVRNAVINDCNNISFICGDAGKATTELIDKNSCPDIIVVDPARKGCDLVALNNIVRLSPQKIVMVSCNPATAARDCAFLCANGFATEKVQPVDLFSRTYHVECVVLMSRR